MSPLLSRPGRSLVLGIFLALPATTASADPFASTLAAPTTRERSQILVAEGDAAYANEHLEEAISKYRAAYYGLSPEDQASYLGSLPVRKAMRAYEQLIASRPDSASALLQRQRVLLVEFLDAVAGREGAAEEIGEDLIAELEQKRLAIDQALHGEPGADEANEPATSAPPSSEDSLQPAQPPTSPTVDDPPANSSAHVRDWLGLGLVIGGSTTVLAGAGLAIGYFTIRAGADTQVESADPMRDPAELDAYLEQEHARARKYLITGSVVAGVGLSVAIAGAVRLAVHRRRASRGPTAVALHPNLTPTTAGLTLLRRF